jgi:hypothetical protein
MPTGIYIRIKYNRVKPAWNKGMKGYYTSGSFKKGHKSIKGSEKGWFKKGEMMEEKHPNWKGNNVGYSGIHKWIESRLGKPHFCEHCGNRELRHTQYNWANTDHKYKRVLKDWIRLCAKCHIEFDNKKIK